MACAQGVHGGVQIVERVGPHARRRHSERAISIGCGRASPDRGPCVVCVVHIRVIQIAGDRPRLGILGDVLGGIAADDGGVIGACYGDRDGRCGCGTQWVRDGDANDNIRRITGGQIVKVARRVKAQRAVIDDRGA